MDRRAQISVRFIALPVILLAIAHLCTGQQVPKASVVGTVMDAVRREPIPGVNVFLAGTTLGAVTDLDGNFTIRNVPAGAYEIVSSIPGFEREILQIFVPIQPEKPLRVFLREKLIEAEGVEVTGERDEEWEDDFERFRRAIFGGTENAEDCSVVNPQVLQFTTLPDERRFVATASAPLVIDNDALGYRIEFVLRAFEVNAQGTIISGFTRFEEKQTDSEGRREEWKEARQRAYEGSLRHFLASLSRNTLQEDGFRVSVVRQFSRKMEASLIPENRIRMEILKPGTAGYERVLTFQDMLKVEFTNEYSESGFEKFWYSQTGTASNNSPLHQISWLRLSVSAASMTLDGVPYDTTLFQTFGYWAYERMGEWLPLDYRPG